jgi:hypothetical protein
MPMPRLVQICASQNDLFGLAGDGTVYQYNFNSNSWTQLGREWGDREGVSKTRSATPPPKR